MTLLNKSRLPKLLLRLEEKTGLGHSPQPAFNLAPGDSEPWETRLYCRRRGEYHLGSLTLRASDPFGLFSRSRTVGEPQRLLVLPSTVDLPLFEPLSRPEMGEGAGRWLVSQLSSNVSSVREYASGDNLKHIHWRSTAHTGKTMVKVFDPDRSREATKSVWVIADMQKSAQAGRDDQSTEEYTITIAASLLRKYLEGGWTAGFVAAGDRYYLIPPEPGERQLGLLMDTLALMKASGSLSPGELISRELGRLGNSLIILVTPSPSEGLASSLRPLVQRGAIVVAVLLDRASFGEAPGVAGAERALLAAGIQVYWLHKGDDLALSLDSRRLPLAKRYAPAKAPVA
ncbi:MAG: DUF58 domain-containing protein [Chloroflexota bacterium]